MGGPNKSYLCGIVGTSSYQFAIRACAVGDPVRVVHQRDNPHDDRALAVLTGAGATIGYIGVQSWIHEAVHEEGKALAAAIASIGEGRPGMLGVQIEVTLEPGPIAVAAFGDGE